jgi:integrase
VSGDAWHASNLVFCHENGTMYTSDALNRRFSKMTRKAGIGHWHAHEGRHTAVSIMSSNGVPIQEISDTVGRKSTHVTETVYRHVIVPPSLAERPSWTTCSQMTRASPNAGRANRPG